MPKSKKSDRIWKLLLASIIASIIVLVGMWVYEWWLARRANNIRYAAFGIEIPGNYSIHGIDVSKYQHIIDWESVKSMNVNDVRIRFAFIKATEGNMNVDRYFKRNWRRTKNASLTRGAYHFFLRRKMERHKRKILSAALSWNKVIFLLFSILNRLTALHLKN